MQILKRSAFLTSLAGLVSCAQTPASDPYTYLQSRYERTKQIRNCDPDMAMCHRFRGREKAEAACLFPKYPKESVESGEQGTTVVSLVIAPDGRVKDIRLELSSSYPRLDEAALAAFSKCVFPTAGNEVRHADMVLPVTYVWKIVEGHGFTPQLRRNVGLPVHRGLEMR